MSQRSMVPQLLTRIVLSRPRRSTSRRNSISTSLAPFAAQCEAVQARTCFWVQYIVTESRSRVVEKSSRSAWDATDDRTRHPKRLQLQIDHERKYSTFFSTPRLHDSSTHPYRY